MSDERQLLAGLYRGEAAALRQIYLRYKDDLLTVARSLVGDVNTAEDCLQDVFVRLASERRRIRRNLKGYLLTSVVNQARDSLRRTETRVKYHGDHPGPKPATTDPARALAESDEVATVMRALAKLSEQQREIIVLHLQGDLRFREIATMLNLSINTVQSRYRYGMERLQQLVTKKEAI